MDRQLDALMRQTRRSWYEDGFSDLFMGAFLLLLGLVFIAQALTPGDSPLALIWNLGWPALLVGGGFLVSYAIQRLKARYTYPRTGYVQYEREGNAGMVRVVGVFLLAVLIAIGVVMLTRGWQNVALVLGIAFAASFLFVGLRVRLLRYLALSTFSLVIGAGIGMTKPSLAMANGLFFAALGLAMLLLGSVTWLRYDRRTVAE